VTKEEGMIELIPLDQDVTNWSDLIGIQIYDRSLWNKGEEATLIDVLDHFMTTLKEANKGRKFSWKILQSNKRAAIYEWCVKEKDSDKIIETEIARAFLTDKFFHRIGFTKKDKRISFEEKEKWIKALRENVSVVPYEKAVESIGLSVVEKLKDSLALSDYFRFWNRVYTYQTVYGATGVTFVPPWQTGSFFSEQLDIATIPMSDL